MTKKILDNIMLKYMFFLYKKGGITFYIQEEGYGTYRCAEAADI